MLLMLSLVAPVQATAGFDPREPDARFTGDQTYTQDGEIKLWSAIERLQDADRTLFTQEQFNRGTAWPTDSDTAPWIDDCFGSREPHSSSFLLHMGLGEEAASGTPILLVHGAGDNGSRSFITMATRLDQSLRPVYALTFAHPHGDVFQQAEIVADAINRIRFRTGAEQVDLVAHSKGGVAAAVYLSNTPGDDWGHEAYETVGTDYRGDVRRAVFVATPLDGIDTSYRWSNNNLVALDADAAISPTSWRTYYPYTTLILTSKTDLTAQDLLSDGAGDLFPGHRQILRRQEAPLPGSLRWLETYALQVDYLTTYEGGYGFYSYSDGIDAAIADGGHLLDVLEARGVDPDVALFLLAGENPVLPNGDQEWMEALFGEAMLALSQAEMAELAEKLSEEGLIDVVFEASDLQGMAEGDLVMGEITGPSDGLVFVSSATRADTLTGRGAEVVESLLVNLSHMDLLYASPVTGGLLLDAAEDDPETWGWATGVAERYIEADTLGWIEAVLADEDTGGPDDTGDTGTGDTGDTGADDSGDSGGGVDTGAPDTGAPADTDAGGVDTAAGGGGAGAGGGPGCGCGLTAPGPGGAAWLALMALAVLRRRVRDC